MRRSTHHLKPLLLLFCLGLAPLAAAPLPPPGYAALVPAEALAVVALKRPAVFMEGLGAFWKAAALDKSLGIEPASLLSKYLPPSADLRPLDPARAWLLVLLPGEGSTPRPLLLLPYRSDPAPLLASLVAAGRDSKELKSLGQGSLVELGRSASYLALGLGDGGPLDVFPPASSADLASLEAWPDEALALWVGPAGLALADRGLTSLQSDKTEPAPIESGTNEEWGLGSSFKGLLGTDSGADTTTPPEWGIAAAMRRLLQSGLAASSDSPSPGPGLENKAQGEAERLAARFLSELASLSLALVPTRSGLSLRLAFEAREGGRLAQLIELEAAAPPALPWTSRLPGEALLNLSSSTDRDFAGEYAALATRLSQRFLGDLGGPMTTGSAAALASLPGGLAELHDLFKLSLDEGARWRAALGNRSAFSLDVDPSAFAAAMAAIQGPQAKPESAPGLLTAALPRFRWISELRDPEAARSLLEGLPTDSALGGLLSLVEKQGGPSLKLASSPAREGSFTWNELSLLLTPMPGNIGPDGGTTLKTLLPALSLRWNIGQAGLVLTNEGPAQLREIALGGVQRGSLATTPAFVSQARLLPPRAQYLAALSTRRIAQLAYPFLPAELQTKLRPEKLGLWLFWLLAEGPERPQNRPGKLGRLEMGIQVPAGDIGVLMELFQNQGIPKGGV